MNVRPEQISEQLGRMLAGSVFQSASRSRAMLEFLIQETLAGRADGLKEYTIGVGALGRPETFDPRTDPIVRAEASRLRTKLETYYASEGKADPVEIVLPRGTYVPQIGLRASSLVVEKRASGFGVWLAGLAIAGIGIAFLAGSRFGGDGNRGAQSAATFLDVELRVEGTVASQAGPDFAISPDGRRIVFIAISESGTPQLYLKGLDSFQTTLLQGTEGVRAPFFSPDGSWVGYWAGGKLKKISLQGGAPVVLCEATDLLGGSWGDDGYIVAAIERQKLSRIAAAGGRAEVVLDLSKEGRTPAWPQVLPGSRRLIFTALGFDGADRANVEVLEIGAGKRSVMAKGATYGRVVAGRWLIYTNQSMVYAQPIRLDNLAGGDEPMATGLRVPYSSTFGYAQYDVSANGTAIFRRTSGLSQVQWLSESGEKQAPLTVPGRCTFPVVSPKGDRFAVAFTESGLAGVMVREIGGPGVTRLPAPAQVPVWSGDGEALILGAMPNLGWVRADGIGGIRKLTEAPALQSPWSFSPDGTRLAYAEFDRVRGFDLWTVPIVKTAGGLVAGEGEPFLQTAAFETYPCFSPDGRWISYASNESGTWEVYVRAFPDDGTKVQVSRGGGRMSRWFRERAELVFRTDDQRLMIAGYRVEGGKLRIGFVRPFKGPKLFDTGVLANFDLAPDGKLMGLLPAGWGEEEQSANHLSLVFEFLSELERVRLTRHKGP